MWILAWWSCPTGCMGNSKFNSSYLQKAMINVWHRLIRHDFYCRSINYHCLSHKHTMHGMNLTKLYTLPHLPHPHPHTCINRSRNRNNPANLTPSVSLCRPSKMPKMEVYYFRSAHFASLDMGQRNIWVEKEPHAAETNGERWTMLIDYISYIGNSHIVQQLCVLPTKRHRFGYKVTSLRNYYDEIINLIID